MTSITSETRIAVIGGGKMGEAILGGWIASQDGVAAELKADRIVVANPGEARRKYLQQQYGVSCVKDASEITSADIVVLAVKPQVMFSVLPAVSTIALSSKEKNAQGAPLFVSIAAGLTTDRLLDALPENAHLVRVMPNTPLMVGAGVTTVCSSRTSSIEEVQLVRDLFACLGSAYIVDEDDMDATGAISGSGPAYVAAVIEALRDAGVQQGLSAELSEDLVIDTIIGTCALMKEKNQTPEETRISVCSPGGTTLAALSAMYADGLNDVFNDGVNAAVVRSKELASC